MISRRIAVLARHTVQEKNLRVWNFGHQLFRSDLLRPFKTLRKLDESKIQEQQCAEVTSTLVHYKTRNRLRVANLSGCVTKILALQRMSKLDFPPEFSICQMHSFWIMYNTMGSVLAVRDQFLTKNGLKTAILTDTILDRLTSEAAETPNLKAIMLVKHHRSTRLQWHLVRLV